VWKHGPTRLEKQWYQDLRSRYEDAAGSAQRALVLRKLDHALE